MFTLYSSLKKWAFYNTIITSGKNILQINEKGQLRLSRRALLPEPNPEKPSAKQSSGNPTRESADTQKANEKVKLKKSSSGPKSKVDNAQPDDRSVDVNITVDKSPPEDKFVKRLVSSGKDAIKTDKSRPEKISNVNGEAKVG